MPKKALTIISFGLALLLDVLAIQALVGRGYWPDYLVFEAAGFHGGGLIFTALALYGCYPKSYQKARWTFWALVLGFSAPLPLIGLFFLSLFRLLFFLRRTEHPEKKYFFGDRQILTETNFSGQAAASVSQSLFEILSRNDKDGRRKAIFALRAIDAKKSLPILQKAIQDSDEQVRLLAQTQLNRIIAGLEMTVKTMEAELAAAPGQTDKLVQLAEQYHELVYLGLSSEETQTLYLARAIELLRAALAIAPENLPAQFLLLKCYVKNQQRDRAKDCLLDLKQAGWPAEFLATWESEIHFQERDWTALQRSLRDMQETKMTDPRLQDQLEFWLGSAPARAPR
jgi:hypothetical protein